MRDEQIYKEYKKRLKEEREKHLPNNHPDKRNILKDLAQEYGFTEKQMMYKMRNETIKEVAVRKVLVELKKEVCDNCKTIIDEKL